MGEEEHIGDALHMELKNIRKKINKMMVISTIRLLLDIFIVVLCIIILLQGTTGSYYIS